MFGHDKHVQTDKIFDSVMLTAKLDIYKYKINKTQPQFKYFKKYLKTKYEIDFHISSLQVIRQKFLNDWILYNRLIDG